MIWTLKDTVVLILHIIYLQYNVSSVFLHMYLFVYVSVVFLIIWFGCLYFTYLESNMYLRCKNIQFQAIKTDIHITCDHQELISNLAADRWKWGH